MVTVLTTNIFDNWIDALKDLRAKTKIQTRIRRMKNGIFWDIEPVGDGFSELRTRMERLSNIFEKYKQFCCVVRIRQLNRET